MDDLKKLFSLEIVHNSFGVSILKKLNHDRYFDLDSFVFKSKEELKRYASKQFAKLLEINNGSGYACLYKKLNEINNLTISDYDARIILYLLFNAEKKSPTKESKKEIIEIACRSYSGYKLKKNKSILFYNGVEIRHARSLSDFLNVIKYSGNSEAVLYRGHSNSNYTLLPSLMREPKLAVNEDKIVGEMLLRCPEEFVNLKSNLEILSHIQHYGAPTRLLDFTSNPLIALYFACKSSPDCNGEVISCFLNKADICYPEKELISYYSGLSRLTAEDNDDLALHGEEERIPNINNPINNIILQERLYNNTDVKIGDLKDIAFVKPARVNQRLKNQDGYFAIWGLDKKVKTSEAEPLILSSLSLSSLGNNKIITVIPKEKKKSILKDLDVVGINRASVFPEIGDVAGHVKTLF